MELGNNALHIYREGPNFRRTKVDQIKLTTRCVQLTEAMSRCVAQNRLNVLDGECKNEVNQQCVRLAARSRTGVASVLDLRGDSRWSSGTAITSATDCILRRSWTTTCV